MSQRERLRWLYVKNRLEELNVKYGKVVDETAPETGIVGIDVDPSWGPVGSMLERLDPYLYQHLLWLDQDRARTAVQVPPEPEAPPPPAETPVEPPPPPARPTGRRKRNTRVSDW